MFKRKTIKKIILLLVVSPILLIAGTWIYNNFFMKVDISEIDRYYDILSKHGKASKYLVLNLGTKEGDDLQIDIDRIRDIMGLKDYEIWIGHHDDPKKPPAYIKDMGYHIMGISMYKGITEKREELNLLTHELGHIYVWNLDKSLLKGCDEEKVVDTSDMFLGLGILVLNGLTDEFFFVPGGGEYETTKKFFGYLYPIQFGYLLARYCKEHGVPEDNITPFLNSTGLKYFNLGRSYLMRQKNMARKAAGEVKGVYWCPNCGYRIEVVLSKKINSLKCQKCSWAFQ